MKNTGRGDVVQGGSTITQQLARALYLGNEQSYSRKLTEGCLAVELDRDVPEYGLRKGDLGAVVEVYEGEGLEVEFVTASGRTAALLTLSARDVRPVADDDLVSVRTCRRLS